jgi:hypothetical protein
MKKNKFLLFDMVCNLDNYAFKIDLKEGVTLVFIKQYLISELMKAKVTKRIRKWKKQNRL